MRFMTLFLVVALIACMAPVANAGGKIGLYADASQQSCEVVDVFPGVVQLHIFYEGDLGASAVAFAAPTPACWTDAVWLADVIFDPWLSGLGDTHDLFSGTLINLRGCQSGTLHLGYMSFQAMGRGEKCCTYVITGSESGGDPAIVDCSTTLVAVDTGALVINPRGNCGCVDGNIVVAVEETTWGQVKALYR